MPDFMVDVCLCKKEVKDERVHDLSTFWGGRCDQNIPHHPAYPAGSSGYITLEHMTTIVDDPSRTTSVGLLRYGAEFMEAALAADEKMGQKAGHEIVAPVPVMFLVGQAIELALKAYLLSKGVELSKLRLKYGHDLHRCLRKAKELGLLDAVPLQADEETAIEILNPLYASKQLQYIVTGAKTFPVFGPLERAAAKLLKGVGAHVGYVPKALLNVL